MLEGPEEAKRWEVLEQAVAWLPGDSEAAERLGGEEKSVVALEPCLILCGALRGPPATCWYPSAAEPAPAGTSGGPEKPDSPT